MPTTKYIIELTEADRKCLTDIVKKRIARKGWNLIFYDDLSSKFALNFDIPTKLKECLKDRNGIKDHLSRIEA